MSAVAALWEGFASFFSIWQVCILQISPFFIAFIVGIYLATLGKTEDPKISRWVVLPCIAYSIGFTIFYSLLLSSGLSISQLLIHHIGAWRVASGVFFLIVGLYLLLVNRIFFLGKIHSPLLLSALSLCVGITFAFIYSPCITPMLSDIMGLASQRNTAVEGWNLAFWYGIGISIALCMTSVVLILFAGKRKITLRNANLIKNICVIILFILAVMNMAGLMTHYKAFALGFVL